MGTFDCSVLVIENGVFEVKSTAGDTHLGGEDFDEKIKLYCCYEFGKKNKMKPDEVDSLILNNSKNYPRLMRLKKECENAKRILSTALTTTISVDSFYDGNDLEVQLSRAKFEDLCNAEFQKSLEPVKRALEDAKLSKSQIDEVVLIGGSTRIPKIRSLLSSFFNNKTLKCDINPDEAVSYGAAVQAAILSGNGDEKTNEIVLLDITPLSLGIETAGGMMSVILPRNTSIPCDKEQTYSTFSDNQPAVTIKIFEGERAKTCDNNKLGEFELSGLPPLPRGRPKVVVKFTVDANGIMSVSAKEESTGVSKNVVIENKSNRLSEEQKKKMLEEAEKYAAQDKLLRDKSDIKSKYESYIYGVRTTVEEMQNKDRIPADLLKEINDDIASNMDWLDKLKLEEVDIEEIRTKLEEVQNKLMPMTTKLYQYSQNTYSESDKKTEEEQKQKENKEQTSEAKIDEVD